MEIRELRAFIAVAEEGSVSGAARRLHVSQSAASQTIQSLERQLGARLLVRTASGVTLTEAGTVLLREARSLIAQHDKALAAVSGQAAASAAALRIGVPLELPADLLPRAVAEMAASFPRTRVEVRHGSSAIQLGELRAGSLDVGLLRERPADPDLDAVLAVEESLGVLLPVARADELTGPSGGIRLHQLAGLAWVAFARGEAPAWHDQIAATLRGHGVDVPAADGEGHALIAPVKFAAVADGQAFALAAPRPGSGDLPDGITWCPLVGNPIIRRTWAVWPASSTRRDLAAFVAALDLTMR
jgi:molybdate transport repressor ModE-like protein